MNMFSGNSDKKVPKSIKECYETDKITSNLWYWCERLEVWGKRLFILLVIIGIVLSVIGSLTVEEVLRGTCFSYTDTEVSFDIMTFITSILSWALYAFIEYCIYHILALLIASLATIVQNTKVTANVNLYKVAKEEGFVEKEEYSILTKPVGTKLKNSDGSWECNKCGTKNAGEALYCKDCGQYR